MDSDEQPKKKSKVSDSLQKNSDLYFSNVGPRFEMIASATLTLEDCSDGMNCCDKSLRVSNIDFFFI